MGLVARFSWGLAREVAGWVMAAHTFWLPFLIRDLTWDQGNREGKEEYCSRDSEWVEVAWWVGWVWSGDLVVWVCPLSMSE